MMPKVYLAYMGHYFQNPHNKQSILQCSRSSVQVTSGGFFSGADIAQQKHLVITHGDRN